MKDDRGSATLFVVLSLPVLLIVLVLASDLGRVYAAKVALKQSAALAARAAAMEIDQTALSDPENPHPAVTSNAVSTFQQVLAQNTGHYKSFFATSPQSDVMVVNPANDAQRLGTLSAPYEVTHNSQTVRVEQSGVVAIVRTSVPLSPLARAVLGKQSLEISVVTAAAPELRP